MERETGVTRTTHSFGLVVVAVLVTVMIGAIMRMAQAAADGSPLFPGLPVAMAFLVPLGLPVLWGLAFLKSRPLPPTAGIALSGLVGVYTLVPGEIGGYLVSYAVLGSLAACGLLSRWRPSLIVVVMCGAMIPIVLASTDMALLDEMFAEQKELALQARREVLMAEQGAGGPTPTLAVEREVLDEMFRTMRRLIPGVTALSLIGQSALSLWLITLLAGRMKTETSWVRLPPFARWRFPFALVWLLALGVGLMIASRHLAGPDGWPPVGINLVLVMLSLAAVQGAAVQWRLSPRSMPWPVRVVLLFMAGFLFLPLVFLGLADQWLDFRKLDTDGPEDRDDNGGDDDAPADKQGG